MRALLMVLMAGGLAAASAADGHLDLARKLLRRGRDKDARLELRAALAIDPDQAEAQALLAGLDAAPAPASPGRTPEAGVPEAGVEARVAPLLARAAEAYRFSDLKAAGAAWREALQLDPARAAARDGLARLEAEAYHRDADQPFDRAVADLYEEGLREMRKGRLVEARRKLEEAKALNPLQANVLQGLRWVDAGAKRQQQGRDAEALLREGRERLDAGEDARAAAAFEAALRAAPGLAEAQAGLDSLKRRHAEEVAGLLAKAAGAREGGDWDGARKAWDDVLALDPANPEALAGRRQAELQRQGARQAAAARREADRHYNGGVEAWQAGDLAAAAAAFRATLAVAPEDAEAKRALAAVLRKLDERSDKDRRDAAQLLAEGRSLETRGALEAALSRYERAQAKDPSLADAAEARQALEKRLKGL